MTEENPNQPPPPQGGGAYSQRFQHTPVSARVPEKAGFGVFSTGALVQTLAAEFVVDFVQNLARPASVVARVIVTPVTMQQMVLALQENLGLYVQKYGQPPALPKPQNPRQPSIQEIYEELKLPEEVMTGCYANTVMIGHSPAEFVLDFITSFYPKAAVAARVYLSAPQAVRLLETFQQSVKNFQTRPPEPPHGGPGPGGLPPGPGEPPLSYPPMG
jgi:hypothetical protein